MAAIRNVLIGLILVALAVLAGAIWRIEATPPAVDYSVFLSSLAEGDIRRVHLERGMITGTDVYGRAFQTYAPDVEILVPKLMAREVAISTRSSEPSPFMKFWSSNIPLLLLLGGGIVYLGKQQRRRTVAGFAKEKQVAKSDKGVTFADVAGIQEAQDELEEIVEFLRSPKEYTRLGGRIPKGVLLQGQPGTGKTLLAKAIAGEAGVPFFSISGSDFVEMYVGVGASRVRDLFRQAKRSAPCIIFIDEIDAVGRHRSASGDSAGGQDEREQTLNALLVEMDGFTSDDTVVIVAATNRPDILDPALLRPGRFDRTVTILPPDVRGRQQILQIYARKVVMADEVDLAQIAAVTPGFTGAELCNLVNEAALLAARKRKTAVELGDLEEAKDKILMGTERKGLVVSEKERRFTAYHESGHAILAYFLPETDPLHKITIIPRGRAIMGVTQQMPLDDRHVYSKEYLANRIKILLGGRTAEEIVFNQYTTGASNDLQAATDIAAKMICEWGMSETLGARAYAKANQSFLGGDSTQRIYSEETARAIDREVNQMMEDCYQEAMIILEGNIDFLHKLAEVLLAQETVDASEIDIILNCSRLTESKCRQSAESVRRPEAVRGFGRNPPP